MKEVMAFPCVACGRPLLGPLHGPRAAHARRCPADPKHGLRRGWRVGGAGCDWTLELRRGFANVFSGVGPDGSRAFLAEAFDNRGECADFLRWLKTEIGAMRACGRWLEGRGL